MRIQDKPQWRGQYDVTVDAKARIVIKAALKDVLGEEFIVARGPDGCIFLYEPGAWEEYVASIDKMPKDRRSYLLQVMVSSQTPTRVDNQHRMAIPKFLRGRSGLDAGAEACVIGQGDRTEVWLSSKWNERLDSFTSDRFEESLSYVE